MLFVRCDRMVLAFSMSGTSKAEVMVFASLVRGRQLGIEHEFKEAFAVGESVREPSFNSLAGGLEPRQISLKPRMPS